MQQRDLSSVTDRAGPGDLFVARIQFQITTALPKLTQPIYLDYCDRFVPVLVIFHLQR